MEILDRKSTTKSIVVTLLFVFACFSLSSSGYLAWLYHLIKLAPPMSIDAVSMGAGYAFQGVGIAIAAAVVRMRPELMGRVTFVALVALLVTCATPAALSDDFVTAIAFGWTMNMLCGAISMFYLLCLARFVTKGRRGIVFGGGYALSILVSWLLSRVDIWYAGVPLELVSCALFSVVAVGLIMAVPLPISDDESGEGYKDESAASGASSSSAASKSLIALACILVLLMSMVKNMGFNFPSGDIGSTVDLEMSRMFYAAGTVIAGLVIDRSRKVGSILCIASLVFPFGLMALSSEPVPSAVLWAVDYFFYGFFSVFRVVLFADIASEGPGVKYAYFAGFGLMVGRFGDSLGTAVGLSVGGVAIALVAAATVLFAATMFVFYQLFQQLYMVPPAPERSERELFDAFAARYGLSPREREVLRLVLDGQTNAEIASTLFVSESTVKFHVRNALKKTGCKHRTDLLARYTQEC